MEFLFLLIGSIWGGILSYVLYFLPKKNKEQARLTELQLELGRKKYETLILKELEDRIGVSLDNTKIVEIILGYLEKVVDYHTVSYLLLTTTNSLSLKCISRASVSHNFINEVKRHMIDSFSVVLNQDLTLAQIEENLTGEIPNDTVNTKVASYFNIPLVVGNQPIGVITVASPKPDIYTERNTSPVYEITNRVLVTVSRRQEVVEREKLAQQRRQQEAEQRAYEAEVLRELEERIGYSLDLIKIIEIITGSIGRLLEYHTVSSMIKSDHRILFKCILRESVNRAFVMDIKDKMKRAFSEMMNRQLHDEEIDESITGTIFDERIKDPVRSYFNIPIVINSEIVGLITVASPKSGLYTEEETSILYTITLQASAAISKLSRMLESEKERLNALVESLTDGIIMIDPEWNLLVLNPRAKEYLSLTKENPTMLDVLDSVSGRIDLRTKIEEAIEKQTIVLNLDIPFRSYSLQFIVIPVKGKSKKLLGSVIVLHDRTKTRQIEEIRNQFEAMMIHDLRAPLTSIRSAVENLDPKITEPDQHTKLSVIKTDTLDMLELVNDFLDVSKLEAGKFTVVKNPENLQVLLQQLVDQYKPLAEEKGLQMQLFIEGDLHNIPVDEFRMKQVVTNFLSNAIKYSAHGTITLSAVRQQNAVTVAVKDEGIGIAKDDIPLLFTKYYQVESSTEKRKGTGLGLVVAKGIVEAHGGSVRVESEVGVGSTFTFTIPLPVAAPKEAATLNAQ